MGICMKKLYTLFKNLKFRRKLFISYLIVCIIPVIVLGAYSYIQAKDFLQQQAKQSLDESIGQIAGNISVKCRQYETITNSITYNFRFQQIFSNNNSNDNFQDIYRDYVDPFFNNILNFNKDILQISVFTNNPQIQRGEYILPLILIKDLQYYKEARKSKQIQWYSKNGKILCMQQFVSAYGLEQTEPAIFFLSIDSDSLFNGLNNIKAPSYGIYVTGTKGQTIFSKRQKIKAIPNSEIFNHIDNNNFTFKFNGEYFILIKKFIPETGWSIYYFTPVNAISIDAQRIVRVTAAISGICIIAMMLVIWVFSNTFVKRINKLNHKMQIVESGNLNIDVTSSSKDEIGELTNRFGKMLNNINILIQEAYLSKLTLKEAELKALQAQINPHFLYNTLSIINWKAIQADAIEISEITNTVSKYYRTVLNRGKSIISVRDEVDNAKAYTYIQLIMHNNKFDFLCEIDEKLFGYEIINLLLQPIIENAIEHGIDRIRKGAPKGKINLRGYSDGNDMVFNIEDNGPGMPEGLENAILKEGSKGYGLKNVHERIQIFFGAQYGVSIKSTLGEGTIVTVRMPIR